MHKITENVFMLKPLQIFSLSYAYLTQVSVVSPEGDNERRNKLNLHKGKMAKDRRAREAPYIRR